MFKKILVLGVLILLQGCTQDARDVVLDYSKIVNELSYINITKGYSSGASEKEKKQTLARTGELKSHQAKLQAEEFNNGDFIGFLYLIDHTFLAENKKTNTMVSIDVGDENVDGSRAKVKVYVSKKECTVSLTNRDGWKVHSIECPSYY